MRNSRHTIEDEKIKQYLIGDEAKAFDVSQVVMERIYNIHETRQGKSPIRIRRKAVVLIICIIIALTSITGYAASRYVQILNKKGEVIVDTKEIREDLYTPHVKTYQKMLSKYKERVQEQLKSGELVAYYVHDDALNAYDTTNKVKTEYKPKVLGSYAAFYEELKKASGPSIREPEYLPAGYAYESGKVFPSVVEGEAAWENLKKLEPEFIREAESSKSGAKLYIKPLIWNKAGSANICFTNGKDTITFGAFHRPKSSSPVTTQHSPNNLVEKLTVNGIDVVYKESTGGKDNYKRRVEWLNEKAEAYYVVSDNTNSALPKSEFIRVVKSIIGK